jgi:hypothetical protein
VVIPFEVVEPALKQVHYHETISNDLPLSLRNLLNQELPQGFTQLHLTFVKLCLVETIARTSDYPPFQAIMSLWAMFLRIVWLSHIMGWFSISTDYFKIVTAISQVSPDQTMAEQVHQSDDYLIRCCVEMFTHLSVDDIDEFFYACYIAEFEMETLQFDPVLTDPVSFFDGMQSFASLFYQHLVDSLKKLPIQVDVGHNNVIRLTGNVMLLPQNAQPQFVMALQRIETTLKTLRDNDYKNLLHTLEAPW